MNATADKDGARAIYMEIDVDKQVEYWRTSADEDWEVGADLVRRGRTRHGLFFVHLALEKMLKAHVCRATRKVAPKLHSLLRLAEIAGVDISREQGKVLAKINSYNLAGRYPDAVPLPPTKGVALERLEAAKEMLEWLKRKL